MKKVKDILFLGVLVLLISALATDSFAQNMHRSPGKHRGKHAKNLENLRMLKLLEVLELDEEQDTKFIAAFASFRKTTREIGENIQKEVELLAEIIKQPTPPDEEIMVQILKIEKMKVQRENAVVDFHKEISNILTPVQLGRMVVFEENFERELIESVRGFRERIAPPMPEPDEIPEP